MHKAFEVHMLNESGKVKAAAIATAFDELWSKLLALTTPAISRETSLVITKLEEAKMFAVKAMSMQPENCVSKDQLPLPAVSGDVGGPVKP